jgi:NADPH:quinone reductase-like Zn-dependent oxidoreductase
MQAVFTSRHGGPGVLEVRELPDPTPAAGEVKIRVHACGVSFADALARQGRHPTAPRPPCVLGYEGAGVVEALGPDASGPEAGTRVVFVSRFGAQASSVCVPATQVATLPSSMSFEAGATLPVDFLAAHHALFEVAQLRPGGHVLVHLAATHVGTAVLQLCATVPDVTTYGTAPAEHHDRLRADGCDHPIDPERADYAAEIRLLTDGRGLDLVVDPLGGSHWKVGYSLLRTGGALVVLGAAGLHTDGRWAWLRALADLIRMPRFSPLRLLADNCVVAGVDVARLIEVPPLVQRQLGALMEHAAAGAVRPRVGRSYRFSEAAGAHRAVEDGSADGKPVLVPDPPVP